MQTKYLIFNSDDFGMSDSFNQAVLRGFVDGNLTSTCIVANADEFQDAVRNILPKCKNLGLGIHLNLFEGKSLTKANLLCDNEGYFNKSFIQILLNSHNKNFLHQIELEFRAQIEKVKSVAKVDHLNSHVHFHAIPKIFELTCKLAKEYDIPYVRTQYEKVYLVLNKIFTKIFLINILKLIILNTFSFINKLTVKKYGLKTNDYIIGIGYTGFMDADILINGLKAVKKKNCVVEVITHPNFYEDNNIQNSSRYKEYLTIINKELSEKIEEQNFKLVNYNNLSS